MTAEVLLVAAEQPAQQVSLHTVDVVRHLLWHKALIEDDDDGNRINGFIAMVQGSAEGEHVSIRDDFHRDLAIAFELVTQEHLDPWNLDLAKFAQLYLKQARELGVDLVTAGRIILMAWTVLKLQSDEVASRAARVEAPDESFDWDSLPDWDLSDEELDFTQRIRMSPRAPIDEKIRHKGDRRVTLMELIDAFEEVHDEADERRVLNQARLQARLSLKRKMRGRVGNMMHSDDLDSEIAETWQRIQEHPALPVPFSGLVERNAVDMVQTFNAVLFLVKDRRIDVVQEDFPHGEIWITPLAAATATNDAGATAEAAV